MALSTTVHDLRTLIRSSHPPVVIETVEEERVPALLQSVIAQERMPLFEWSATRRLTCAEIEQAVVAALYRALHQKAPLTTDLLIEELTHTVPLSVTRREDIDALRQTAEGRFVNVR